ncbi:PEPxxWA-CTERM sorting domain-containing protein [Erythrobacter sp. LQ02-29]|uniref:PEPxxWA-CTERM sorting domain-containing protein n=1 Tax=Erythrobacter sp. LQ02-29 TaxID=2920384 RepID=UPI001F4F0FC7|nr:PEPxxWA-CTERM sorting domain-containing protein [Erythrobacter sp. LQ02-29]MCP9222460.1 PEPxxWA-CTERM sorting domain-containing protein [Erythrobacter sp. LQ02-29]
MKRLSVISAAVIGASMMAVPASAAPTINFGTKHSSATSGAPGNTRTFTGTDNGQTINVTASAWSVFMNVVTSAYLGDYANGLGVTNFLEGRGANNTHTIDNSFGSDFILLTFDQPVSLPYAYLSAYGDTDVTFASLSSGDTKGWNGSSVSKINSLITSSDNSYGGTGSRWAANESGGTSANWIVGALTPRNQVTDSFKLGAVVAQGVPGVPEPATWMMLILGFGAIGFGMRRQRSRTPRVSRTVRYA